MAAIKMSADRFSRSRIDNLVNLAFGKAAGPDNIGDVDALHPIKPFGLDAGIKGYLHTVDNHEVRCSTKPWRRQTWGGFSTRNPGFTPRRIVDLDSRFRFRSQHPAA
jgi:hypothetical protein